jgi:transcription termination/antitermination protein NusA
VNREILEAIKMIEREKGISSETLILALEDALLAAYKKTPGAAEFARVSIDREEGDMRVLQLVLDEDEEPRTLPVVEPEWPEGGPPEDYVPPAPEIDWTAYDEDELEEVDVSTDNFGRIAAQTAKQVVLQRIREAEREMMFDEYVDRVGDVVTGIIQQSDSRYTLVDLGRVEALLPESEQVRGERYDHGARVKAVIVDVRHSTKGPQVIVSRRSDELIKRLFELEVPEMADGLVEIRAVAREAGWRSKIAVISKAQGVDPVGACVGPRGSRVRMVVSELRGEKIDIIPFNDEPARFVAKALSPARVREVLVDDENRQATVIVPDDQLSLAIGKEGMNARLAARLTGWRIDIKSESTFALEESAAEFGGTGQGELQRCAALLRNGKRCVNAAVPGTRYCSLPAHARLAEMEAEGIEIAPDQAVGIAGAEATPATEAAPADGGATTPVDAETVAPDADATAADGDMAAQAEPAAEEPAEVNTDVANDEVPTDAAADSNGGDGTPAPDDVDPGTEDVDVPTAIEASASTDDEEQQ